jgi:HEAT repeat protein
VENSPGTLEKVGNREVEMVAADKISGQHSSDAQLVERALEGDLLAANQVVQYLGSANPHLRRIMQDRLHRTAGEKVWKTLLNCLALQCWSEIPVQGGGMNIPRRADPDATDRFDRAVVETFVDDKSQQERETKLRVLQAALRDRDALPQVRHVAAYVEALRGNTAVIPVLEQILESGDLTWKLRAVEALGTLKDKRCGPALVKALAMGPEVLHKEARRQLSEMGELAVPAWLQALKHPDGHIRWHAACGLSQVGKPVAIQILAEGLLDENHAVRWATARALARLDAVAIPAVLTIISRNRMTEPLREAAYHALHAMVSRRTQERIRPLLNALLGPAASVEAPAVAQHLLAEW